MQDIKLNMLHFRLCIYQCPMCQICWYVGCCKCARHCGLSSCLSLVKHQQLRPCMKSEYGCFVCVLTGQREGRTDRPVGGPWLWGVPRDRQIWLHSVSAHHTLACVSGYNCIIIIISTCQSAPTCFVGFFIQCILFNCLLVAKNRIK